MMLCMALKELSWEVLYLGSLESMKILELFQSHPSMEVYCPLHSSVFGFTVFNVIITTPELNSLDGSL